MSPFFKYSVKKRFVAQVKNELGLRPRKECFTANRNKVYWLKDINVQSIYYEQIREDKVIHIDYTLNFKDSSSYQDTCWLYFNDGIYKGHAEYGCEHCGTADSPDDSCQQSVDIKVE